MRRNCTCVSITFYPVRPDTLRPYPRVEQQAPCTMCAKDICQPGWCVDGIETNEISTAPECNFHNGNAGELLRITELPRDGWLGPEDIEAVIARVEQALRGDVSGPFGRAAILHAGKQFHRVLLWALENKAGVAWA
jgi:hypothetical protein